MNIKHYFIRKTMKRYSRLSSAAVVIGALRVKIHTLFPLLSPKKYLGRQCRPRPTSCKCAHSELIKTYYMPGVLHFRKGGHYS